MLDRRRYIGDGTGQNHFKFAGASRMCGNQTDSRAFQSRIGCLNAFCNTL